MRRIQGALVAVGAAGALLSGGCELGESSSSHPNSPEVSAAFDAVQEYWIGRGILSAAETRLVTLGPGDEADCSTWDIVTQTWVSQQLTDESASLAAYCHAENAVTVSETSFEAFLGDAALGGVPPSEGSAIVMAHEWGHEVQLALNPYEYTPGTAAELQADCLGGMALQAVAPNVVAGANTFHMMLGGDSYHGTAQQRADSFQHGVAVGDCGIVLP